MFMSRVSETFQLQEQGEREFVMFRSRVSETLSTSGAG